MDRSQIVPDVSSMKCTPFYRFSYIRREASTLKLKLQSAGSYLHHRAQIHNIGERCVWKTESRHAIYPPSYGES